MSWQPLKVAPPPFFQKLAMRHQYSDHQYAASARTTTSESELTIDRTRLPVEACFVWTNMRVSAFSLLHAVNKFLLISTLQTKSPFVTMTCAVVWDGIILSARNSNISVLFSSHLRKLFHDLGGLQLAVTFRGTPVSLPAW